MTESTDVWTATVDYGDGTGVNPLSLNADKTFALDHRYLDNGDFTITVRVFDGHEYGIATFDVMVANLAPVAAVSGPDSGVRGQPRTFTLSAADPSPADQTAGFTFAIDWGDGTVDAGDLLESNGSGTVSGSHRFAAEGPYVVTVTVRDAAGNSDADTFTVAVRNASLRQPAIDVIASDPSVSFVNLTGPLVGIGPNQVAEFDVRLTGPTVPGRFDLLFLRPATSVVLGSIPVTVNDTYVAGWASIESRASTSADAPAHGW